MVRHLRSIMRITWIDKVTNKEILGTDRVVIHGRSSDQKESPVDWTHHENVTRKATKADPLLSTVCWSQKVRAPSSPVQGYHQENPKAGRHKDRLMDISLIPE